ncbi:MAG: hypothetical protein GXP27_02460, partial [Planctomycetes bacterium]|nr:hypothetical protein [Planctomycetota bacterium]
MKTLRVTLKYALVLLLLLVAVGGWYGYQQWVRRGELIRQQILSQAAQLAPHWDVRIGACRLELLNRVRLENLSLGARDQARPILTLP